MDFKPRLKGGRALILDGATGTELEKRGVRMDGDAWSAIAALTHPDVLTDIHADYVRSGANVITTNTYAANDFVIDATGRHGQHAALINASVDCAKRARDISGDCFIAGSISGMAPGLDPSRRPSPRQARKSFSRTVALLAEGDCDLIAVEMLRDLDYAPEIVGAAKETGLPVIAGISFTRSADGNLVGRPDGRAEVDIIDVVRVVIEQGPDALAVMHTDIELASEALDILRSLWKGPLAAYPHSGHFKMPHWNFSSVISPEEFAEMADEWHGKGCFMIGGCCGIGPEHIRCLAERAERSWPSS